MEKNHTIAMKTGTFSPAHKKTYNSLDFQKRQVFQVGHFVELLQLCSLCLYALNHMTMNRRAVIYINSI
jgi:hypothetical protein